MKLVSWAYESVSTTLAFTPSNLSASPKLIMAEGTARWMSSVKSLLMLSIKTVIGIVLPSLMPSENPCGITIIATSSPFVNHFPCSRLIIHEH